LKKNTATKQQQNIKTTQQNIFKMIKRAEIRTMGKYELMGLIHGVGRDLARNTINRIIAENRKISEEKAKNKKMVSRPEIIKVLDYFGFEME